MTYPDDGVHRGAEGEEAIRFDAPETFIVVSKEGDDTNGNGSFESPLLTLTAAKALWTAARPLMLVLPGEYDEALVWPSITGLILAALIPGTVTLTDGGVATALLTIAPTYTASSFEASIKGIALSTMAQIGLSIANAAMTKKLIVDIDGLTCEADSTGNSITIAGTVSGQAIRVYAKDLNCEGLVEFTANDAGSRLRVKGGELMGGLTTIGAVAAQTELMSVVMKASGLTIATEWLSSNTGCLYRTDSTGVAGTFADTANG
jgi:hypothetical protein